jgi:hypothetical protein
MATDKCLSIKDSILSFVAQNTIVEQMGNMCVATLPIPTVDGRFVDVFIESKIGDYIFVHDGGKAANEMIIQGMDLTESVHRACEQLAHNFGVSWVDETFQSTCKLTQLNRAVMNVAACSSLATFHLVGHEAAAEENPIRGQVGVVLRKWARKRATVKDQVTLQGKLDLYAFDFLVRDRSMSSPVAVSVVHPTGGALSAAQRFGFKMEDLRGTQADKWKQLVVEVKSEAWSAKARRIIAEYADGVIEIGVDKKPVQSEIATAMERLA